MKNIFIFSILVSFFACEPAYEVCIVNDLDVEVSVKTNPSINAIGNDEMQIKTQRKHESSSDIVSKYLLLPHDTLWIYAYLGTAIPNKDNFELQYVELSADSTIVCLNKNQVIAILEKHARNIFTSKYKILASRLMND